MTKEEELVVNPLYEWFQRQKADWKLYRPRYGTSSTGWDLEARRRNQDLLIEAKFINGPFLASFAGLVTAPLAKRPQRFVTRKYRSWCYGICWAVGSNYETRNVYQILLDYFSRNPRFWQHYCRDLRAKYVFFVSNKMVAKVPFKDLLAIAAVYAERAEGKGLRERRSVADELMKKYEFS